MRAFAIAFAMFAVAACQRADSAERSAAVVAQAKVAPVTAPGAAMVMPAPVAEKQATAGTNSCGGGGGCGAAGGSCGGGCGAEGGGCSMGPQGCTGGVTEMPDWKPVPANATWTDLRVTGMHCGGCARRIEKRLASVDGVLGVKIDVTTAQVTIATLPGVDARALVKSPIDTLGYRVE